MHEASEATESDKEETAVEERERPSARIVLEKHAASEQIDISSSLIMLGV